MSNKKIKIIAFYLPQFHRIPENDKWWGVGFTEWTSVKQGKPLFPGHYQPRIPLNNNYYDLMDPNTFKWQIDLAKKYSIHGFCFYHYWSNGKKILEKPIEKYLNNKGYDLPFCFSWANHSWTRIWEGKKKTILWKQEYGDKKDWEDHFNYLLNFFKDDRYIKINNKPCLVIYESKKIKEINQMLQLWNKLAIKHGFPGLYIIETIGITQKKPFLNYSNAILEFEPMHSITKASLFQKTKRAFYRLLCFWVNTHILYDKFDYDKMWNIIINKRRGKTKKDLILGAFVDWDNTPRRGWRGSMHLNIGPKKFKKYLTKQLCNAQELNAEFLFINAWNEWAEGAYMEPDEKYKYSYLEAVKSSLEDYNNQKN